MHVACCTLSLTFPDVPVRGWAHLIIKFWCLASTHTRQGTRFWSDTVGTIDRQTEGADGQTDGADRQTEGADGQTEGADRQTEGADGQKEGVDRDITDRQRDGWRYRNRPSSQ